MNSPSSFVIPHSSLPERDDNPLAGTGPDLELAPDCPSREFPVSSFDPCADSSDAPRRSPALRDEGGSAFAPLDYDTVIHELDRLEMKVRVLKRAAGLSTTDSQLSTSHP